ncbi:hypothetical protein KE513_00370 [Oscillospiraceae bacterium Marseille-Q3528]|nr:hypothetical protein [Oscillospiraceae bacterium Marseille-Q3528]
MAGIPISKLEENTTLSDSSMFAEAESSPASTKKVTFATLFSAIWNKIKGKRVKTYDEIMATTDDEFWASATGIKDGFEKTDSKKIVIKETGKSFPETNVGANTSITLTMAPTTHDGYTCIGISGFGGTDGPVVIQAARFNPGSGKLTIKIRNTSSAAYKCTPTVDVLYAKNENVTIK